MLNHVVCMDCLPQIIALQISQNVEAIDGTYSSAPHLIRPYQQPDTTMFSTQPTIYLRFTGQNANIKATYAIIEREFNFELQAYSYSTNMHCLTYRGRPPLAIMMHVGCRLF
jgi:hypothetical protein